MFTSVSPSAATWFTDSGSIDATTQPGHSRTDDSNGRSAPANVTTVLTVTNISINKNGADYFCAQGFNVRSDTVFLTVFGKLTTDHTVLAYVVMTVHYIISLIISLS